jgi:hypothetical protein
MAEVILVHGIGHEQDSADTIENAWSPALAGGVRTAGFDPIADRLWRQGPVAGGFVVRAAYYGHLFRRAGTQGAGGVPLTDETQDLADQLALAILERALQSEMPEQQRVAQEELAAIGQLTTGQPQGLRSISRSLLARLARLPFFAKPGMAFAERFVLSTLQQVTGYLTDEDVREQAQQEILSLVDNQTQAIVGHSLGSVVAYEACFRLHRPLQLLVTIGSPLGLSNIVYDRLRPQPPVFPPLVRRWVNIADRNDVVAAEPNLGRFFGDVPLGAVFEPGVTVDNGRNAHLAVSYLTAEVTGRPIGETLRG